MTPRDAPFVSDRFEADDLDTYLDALVAGQRSPATDLPPTLAATAQRVHRLSDAQVAPRLSHAESARIWEDLMQTHAVSPTIFIPGPFSGAGNAGSSPDPAARHRAARLHLVGSTTSAPAPVALGERSGRTLRHRWNRHGWPIVELLGVAALIIGLVSVLVGGIGGGNHNGGQPSLVPGIANLGTATPETASDGLAALPDPGQTGVMPGPGLTGNPELVWRVPIQDVTSDLFVSDGTIVRARFSDQIPADLATTNPWFIDALSARAGTPIWESKVEAAGVRIGGIWQGTIVLVASGEYGPIRIGDEEIGDQGQGFVIGMDLATGAVQWSSSLVNEAVGPPTVNVPTISNGVAYIPTTLGPMFSVNIADGSINWTATIDDLPLDQINGASFSRPAVSNDTVSAYSIATGKVYSLDAGTGEQRWALQVNDPPVLGTPVAGIDVIREPAPSVSGPTIAGGRVYVSIGSYSGDAAQSLMAIDLATGKALWTTELGSIDLSDPNRQLGVSQPYVTDDAVIVSIGGSDGNRLLAFSPDTGDQLWEHRLSDEQSSSMSIVDGTGYVARTDGFLTGIDLQTGDELWSVQTGGALHAAPYLIDGMLYQAADDGQLYALGSGKATATTPGATPNISGLPACDVAPRAPASDVFAMAANRSPAATLAEPVYVGSGTDQFPTAPTIAWDDLPVGSPADADVTTAIQQTVDGVTTCTRAGDPAQVAAYYTDDFFSRPYNLNAGGPVGSYFTSSEIPVMSGDLRVLDDGRVGMIATEGLISREIGQNEARLYIFAEQPDGQWLIDEVVIVNNRGEAPQG